jgi:predicted metal-dependent phosphotriesterase family hydrolase
VPITHKSLGRKMLDHHRRGNTVVQAETDPIGAFGEVGSSDYMTKDERKVFRAIGRAHLATNIPIFTKRRV